jgi:hypothetical protein
MKGESGNPYLPYFRTHRSSIRDAEVRSASPNDSKRLECPISAAFRIIPALLLCALSAVEAAPSGSGAQRVPSAMRGTPAGFTENRGQLADTDGKPRRDIAYYATVQGVLLAFRPGGVSAVWSRSSRDGISEATGRTRTGALPESEAGTAPSPPSTLYRMDMTLEGGNTRARLRADGPLPGLSHYYLAHCPDGVLGVRSFSTLVFENVYERIDLVYEVSARGLKYSFLVHPGGRVSDIRMRYGGADRVLPRGDGGLRVLVPGGGVEEERPTSWLDDGTPVDVRFRIAGETVGFEAPARDAARELVIDPWATYYGGDIGESVTDMACDGAGALLFAGVTRSAVFPVHAGVQMQYGGFQDAFVGKFDLAGPRLWATFYGGNAEESIAAVAADNAGNVVLGGTTLSANLPLASAFQIALQGSSDGFLVRLTSSGTRVWASYVGGNNADIMRDVAVDAYATIFFTGSSGSTNFPLASGGFQPANAGGNDAVLFSVSMTGLTRWASYFGGGGSEQPFSVAVDGFGDVTVLGSSTSSDLPVSAGAFQTAKAGAADAFVLKVSNNGYFVWATYFGGTGTEDQANASVAVDPDGNVFFTGRTLSTDFPVSSGAYQTGKSGGWDAFAVKLDSTGNRAWATYFGASGDDLGYGLALTSTGSLVLSGSTTSANFPVQNAWQGGFGGAMDVWVAKFTGAGYPNWATFYGGPDQEAAYCVAADVSGVIAVGGATQASFPLVRPFQQAFGGYPQDGFLLVMTATGDMLPVELTAFSGTRDGNAVTLRWSTASERNNAGFAVERCADPELGDWERRGFVPAVMASTGPRDYQFTDDLLAHPAVGPRLLYRLRQIDTDGRETLSPSIEVSIAVASFELLSIHPQPSRGDVWVSMRLPEDGDVTLSLSDAAGRELPEQRRDIHVAAGTHMLRLVGPELKAGVYFLRVFHRGVAIVRPLIVE